MAGERSNSTSANNESRASVIATEVGKSKKHQENASSAVCGVRGDQQQQPLLHSRVGGISECDPLGSKNLALRQQEISQGEENDTCRYAVNQSNNNMSFMEVCQIRLQQLFPQIIQNQDRFHLCEEKIELTAECLANDVIRYLLKEDLYLISTDPVSRSMRHNVYQMLNKHSILFTSMVNRLNVVPDTAYEAFMGVADELFDQGITWARIVCLYAFMGRLALWARDRRMYSLKEKLPMYVSRYINEEIAQFIKIYGGWEQLCIEYPVAEELSGAVWRSLLMTGATLGLVATILTVTS